jgi:nitrate/TMAO reductase-like tetraheme cytochrome c subunit
MDMSQTEWKRTGEKYSKTCKNIHCNGEMSRKNKVLISRI